MSSSSQQAAGYIDSVGGFCPVQGEGKTNDGRDWYFRARGRHWSFCVAERIGDSPVDVGPGWGTVPGWYVEEQYGEGDYCAGWMGHTAAVAIIGHCLVRYRAGDLPKVEVRSEQ